MVNAVDDGDDYVDGDGDGDGDDEIKPSPPNASLNSTPRITHHANNKATLSGGFVYRLIIVY